METATKSECIFCSIVQHRADASIIYEDDACMAFRDIHPEAPTHVLVIPKIHVEKFSDLATQTEIMDTLMVAVLKVIQKPGVEHNSKIAINNGKDAGQIIPHVHVHVLSKQKSD